MSHCLFCGPDFIINGKFCNNCGKNNDDIKYDEASNLNHFNDVVSESFFELEEWHELKSFISSTHRLRDKFSISFEFVKKKFDELSTILEESKPLSEFTLEFNQNVIDALAGHDTYLSFKFTNLSQTENYKIYIHWDDRETEDEEDLHIKSNLLIKKNQPLEIGGTHIFFRAGPKEINDLRIIVTNQFKDKAIFKVSPFTFRVKNPTQNTINQITTKNEISIEGRGVVDAANMGSQQASNENEDPDWIKLSHVLDISFEEPNMNQNQDYSGLSSINKSIDNQNENNFEINDDKTMDTVTADEKTQSSSAEYLEVDSRGHKILTGPELSSFSQSKFNLRNHEYPGNRSFRWDLNPLTASIGDTWSGSFDEQGLCHGYGTYTFSSVYHNLENSDGVEFKLTDDDPQYPPGEHVIGEWHTYVGKMFHGEFIDTGRAHVILRNNCHYFGSVFWGAFNGWGEFVDPVFSGTSYIGMFNDNYPSGYIEEYEVEFIADYDESDPYGYINSLIEYDGIEINEDGFYEGFRCTGGYNHGVKLDTECQTNEDFFRYGGYFLDNKFGFIGFYPKDENNRGQYLSGTFNNDRKLSGDGNMCIYEHELYADAEKDMHFGAYENGLAHGLGVRIYQDGSYYYGNFKNHERFGEGIVRKKDGTEYKVINSEDGLTSETKIES